MSDTEHAQIFTRTAEKTPPYLACTATAAGGTAVPSPGDGRIPALPWTIAPAGGAPASDTSNCAATLCVTRVLIRCTQRALAVPWKG